MPDITCDCRLVFIAELEVFLHAGCNYIDVALGQELFFTCVMLTKAKRHRRQSWGLLSR